MDLLWFLLILGLLQGLTEVFPISSTGHLAIFRQVFNIPSFNLALAAGLHGGSLIAISIYFRKEIGDQLRNLRASLAVRRKAAPEAATPFLSSDQAVPYLLALSLIPVAFEGLVLRPLADGIFEQQNLVLFLLILNGGIILLTAFNTHGERTIKELNWKEYLLIGLVQGVAVLPGISRLGIVLCTSLWLRLKWQEALKLTFILAVPVLAGALVVEARDIIQAASGNLGAIFFLSAGVLLAALTSWLGLRLLTSRWLERRKVAFFGYYCIIFGSYSLLYLHFWGSR